MNLYYIYQDENTGEGTYHAAVVAALTKEEAKATHPAGDWNRVDMWCYDEESVKVRLIGAAAKPVVKGIVLTSNS